MPKIPKQAEAWTTKHGENTKTNYCADFAPSGRNLPWLVAEYSGHQLLPNPGKYVLSSLISYKSKHESQDIQEVSVPNHSENRTCYKISNTFPGCDFPSKLFSETLNHDPVAHSDVSWNVCRGHGAVLSLGKAFLWYFMSVHHSNSSLIWHLKLWLGCTYQVLHIYLYLCTYIYTYI